MGNRPSILSLIFDMKIKARELKRQSDRCYRESAGEKSKVKLALLKHNKEGARIFAQNFIRKQQEAVHCLQLSSKLDAAASRLDAAYRSQQMSSQVRIAAFGLAHALRLMDGGTSLRQMEEFAKLFDDLDVRSDSVSTMLDASTSTSIPLEHVDKILQDVATAASIPFEPDFYMARKNPSSSLCNSFEAGKGDFQGVEWTFDPAKEPRRGKDEPCGAAEQFSKNLPFVTFGQRGLRPDFLNAAFHKLDSAPIREGYLLSAPLEPVNCEECDRV